MGVLKKFEQRLEGMVNGAFAKAFKSDVQPVEIASALKRECDSNATIWNRDRTMVPNDFVVELGSHDYERLSPYAQQLGAELSTMVRDYAQQQRYSFIGPVEVHFEQADDLDTGLYRVRSQALAGSQSQGAPGYGPPAGAAVAAGGSPPYGADPRYAPPGPHGGPPQGPAPHFQQPPPSYQQGGMPPSVPMGGPPGGLPPRPPSPPPGPAPAPYRAPVLRSWVEINGLRHDLNAPAVKLGRSTDADVRVDDPSVSRHHAEIRVGPPPSIADLGSTNGIVVDGQHCQRAALRDGSRIVLGSTTVVFRQTEG
ncbi:FhaA domain-containing protein [Yinghuangia sp. YIM S10712]|uniref:FhaA domain-containing protein n=1 Tax=Yinghuangia sp. YIM S10712 TaxID=3436930 RepID=UPI003F52D4F0